MKPILNSCKIFFLILLIGLISCSKNISQDKNVTQFKVSDVKGWLTEMTSAHTLVAKDSASISADSLKKELREIHLSLMAKHPVLYDWWLQDGEDTPFWFDKPIKDGIISRIKKVAETINVDISSYQNSTESELIVSYVDLCNKRREKRLKDFTEKPREIIYSKYSTLLPSFYAYTEGLSDARGERNFFGGSEISKITTDGIWTKSESIIKDSLGVFRDLEVSFDSKNAIFAWKKSLDGDDFHIYEMNLDTYKIKQITEGDKIADIEPIYLPDGNILFNSTRCGSSVDCWFTEVSNMYICDRDGRHLRRIGFDQVHTSNPTLLSDGRVVYTRWDYNDRGQVFTQPLFQMNYDGTSQAEYYGLNSWFPTTVTHAREIPGTRKIMATILGHHNPQHGKLGIIDPEAGRDEIEGVTLVSPVRTPTKDRIDSWGQYTDQFQHPFPLNPTEFLISYTPLGYHIGHPMRFGIYWMNIDGERELLAYDKDISSNNPILIEPRDMPFKRNSEVDFAKNTGSYYLQDVYASGSLEGIERGSVKKLRIVEIEFRAAGLGMTFGSGKGGTSHASSAVGVGNTSWDLKKVLGTVDVYADGSSFFEVPARTPIYFQALDSNNYVIQTMRSWSTLQGGEMQSCVGCHEHKNTVPLYSHPVSEAMNRGIQKITPYFDGEPRNFGFIDEIQPLLDRECVSCHDGVKAKMSLKGDLKVIDNQSKRKYSDAYINLTHARRITEWNNSLQGDASNTEVNWVHGMGEPTLLKPYSAGAATSNLIKRLKTGHGANKLTPKEIEHIALWIDLLVPFISEYRQAGNWTEKEMEYYNYYETKRDKYTEIDRKNIEEYIKSLF